MTLYEQADRLELEIKKAEAKLGRLQISIVARKNKLNRLLDRIYENAASLPYEDESTKSE